MALVMFLVFVALLAALALRVFEDRRVVLRVPARITPRRAMRRR